MSAGPHYGINQHLEDQANEIIFGHLHKIVSHEEKSDVLTPWKERDRRSKEVLHEAPDGALIRGDVRREFNPRDRHLNHQMGASVGNQRRTGSVSQHREMEFDGD